MALAILLLVLVGVPVVEIATFIKAGAQVGVFGVIAFTFLTAFLGVALVRWQGFQALQELRRTMDAGKPPVVEIASGALLLLAGVLLLIPGFVTDAAGFALLVPPLRRALAAWLTAKAAETAQVRVRTGEGATIIEAEVVEIDEEAGRIGHGDSDSPWRGR